MSFFESLIYAISEGIVWMTLADYNGITPMTIAILGLVLTLFWRFIISPILGGGARIGASDRVKDSKKKTQTNNNED